MTEEQVAGFRSFGFAVLPGLLESREVAALDNAFQRAFVDAPRHRQFGQAETRMVAALEDGNDAFAELVASRRIVGALRRLLGRDALFLGSFGLLTRGDTPWHTSGMPGEGPDVVRVTSYLDDSSGGDGPLSVLVGSHRREYARALFQAWGAWSGSTARLELGRDAPGAFEIDTRPGDVVVWLPRSWHAAWKRQDDAPRRGVFLSWMPDPGADRLLAEALRRAAQGAVSPKRPYLYGPRLLGLGSPEVAAMASRLEELGVANVVGSSSGA